MLIFVFHKFFYLISHFYLNDCIWNECKKSWVFNVNDSCCLFFAVIWLFGKHSHLATVIQCPYLFEYEHTLVSLSANVVQGSRASFIRQPSTKNDRLTNVASSNGIVCSDPSDGQGRGTAGVFLLHVLLICSFTWVILS